MFPNAQSKLSAQRENDKLRQQSLQYSTVTAPLHEINSTLKEMKDILDQIRDILQNNS